MKVNVCLLIAMLAIASPAQALLGAKLALLGALRNSFGGGNSVEGYGNGEGYGGGYSSGYGRGYATGGYANSISYNRPVYTGQSSNYGWGKQSYGGGYAGGYNAGYNGGNEETVRVIKVIVSHEQPQMYYNNYARSSSSASASAGASWTAIPAPIPIVRTYAAQPVQSVQVSAPAPVSVSEQPVQSIQVSAPAFNQVPAQIQGAPAPVQVIQPPPRPFYVQSQQQPQYIQRSQPVYQQVTVQRPIQYPIQQPVLRQTLPVYQQPQPHIIYQQTQQLPVSTPEQHTPAKAYGPPPPPPTFVAPSIDNADTWNSDFWRSASSGNGLSNIGTGPWISGSIRESIGC